MTKITKVKISESSLCTRHCINYHSSFSLFSYIKQVLIMLLHFTDRENEKGKSLLKDIKLVSETAGSHSPVS